MPQKTAIAFADWFLRGLLSLNIEGLRTSNERRAIERRSSAETLSIEPDLAAKSLKGLPTCLGIADAEIATVINVERNVYIG